MDIVGYSRRPIEVQAGLIESRDRIAKSALDALEISQAERQLHPLGDGLYIALLTPNERFDVHLHLALKILRELAEQNRQANERERFELRFGIDESTDNLITDINDQPNVAGVGANMAARIIAFADAAQILVSQSVHKQLYMREEYMGQFRELAPVVVKHGERLQIYQYIRPELPGLSVSVPAKWEELSSDEGAASNIVTRATVEPESLRSDEDQSATPSAALTDVDETNRRTGENQILSSVQALITAVKDSDFAKGFKFSESLDEFQLLRLKLLTTVWLQTRLATTSLDNHEANRLYLIREELHLTRPELLAILRMLVGDSSGYIPGWYWHREINESVVERVVLYLGTSDHLAFLRQEAFDLLASAAIPLPESVTESVSLTVRSDSVPEVRRAAVKYLGRIGTEVDLPVVGSALVDAVDGVSREAKKSKYLILARTSPDRAFKELIAESGIEVDEILTQLRLRMREITLGTLRTGLESSSETVRLAAVRELRNRGALTIADATALKEDKSDAIKSEAYAFLIDSGESFESDEIAFKIPDHRFDRWMSRQYLLKHENSIDRSDLLLRYYRRFDVEQLLAMSSWDRWDGEDAYRALAVAHFDRVGDKVRLDLGSDFSEASNAYYEHELAESKRIWADRPPSSRLVSSRSIFGNWLTEERTPEESAKSSVEARKQKYVGAALAGLAHHGIPSDAEFGKRFLFDSDTDIRIEAVKVIRQCGSPSEVPDLIKVATTTDASLQELAAKAAFQLSEQPFAVARQFLETNDEILTSITVAELIVRGDRESNGFFLEPYLDNANENVRTRVMVFFLLRYDRDQLVELLTRYSTRETYYYDVVCCFDRALYSPPRLATAYQRKLRDRFFGFLDEYS